MPSKKNKKAKQNASEGENPQQPGGQNFPPIGQQQQAPRPQQQPIPQQQAWSQAGPPQQPIPQQQAPPQQTRPHQQPIPQQQAWSQAGPPQHPIPQQQAPPQQARPHQQPIPQQQAWSQAGPPPGFTSQTGNIPQQAWPQQHTTSASSQQKVPTQIQGQAPQVASSTQQTLQNPENKPKPKVKGNKYPKKETPPAEPQATTPQSTTPLGEKMEQIHVTPTKALVKIESSPDGRVYQGSRGRKCNLEVNYLEILVKNLIPKAFHYDVNFEPDIPKKMLPIALDTFMKEHFKSVFFAFDGRKNFYTNQLLSVKGVTLDGPYEKEVVAVLGDRSKPFKVKVQFATEVDMSVLKVYRDPKYQHNDKPSQAIQCLDVILRTVFKSLTQNNRAVAVGRALYFAGEGRPLDLGEGMELWIGLFQSAILGRQSLYLNVDVAHKAFPSQIHLLDFLAALDRNGQVPTNLGAFQMNQLNDYLKMLTIGYQPSQNVQFKTFGYNGLKGSPKTERFVDSDGKNMTVLEYFERVKKIRLRFPDLPLLHVGSKVRNIYLPIEFCSIPAGQATNKKVTPNCVAQMIKYSATSTDERKRKIQNLLNKINYAEPGKEIKGFGIDVDKKFQNVEGRVIDAPKIKYLNGGPVIPRNGVWRGGNFLETQIGQQIKWAIVNCDDRTRMPQVIELKKNLLMESRKLGMNLANTSGDADVFIYNMQQSRRGDMESLFAKCSQNGYKLVFVIITERDDCYAQVKQAAELKVGILTQCIKANTVFRMGKGNPMMTIGNILLKVNAKLNGKNHEVVEQSYQTALGGGVMFVGADVTHPSPDQRDIPSVVGVAASYDNVGFRYQCAWRLQDPKKEMIEDLQAILQAHLNFYKSKNGSLPGKIMYYRDGVSDGQFSAVLEIEMTAIRAAMKAIYGTTAHAKVTFVVVQKRHHTRFFPTDQRFSDSQFGGRNNNILAGTVVDKDIVHPFQYQFFMASHAAIQGVTKPTKYCVLINESKIGPDDLQAITYDLCHLFTRCNRSVSYPAPTYYAHLVAARGKQYIIGARLNMNDLNREFRNREIRPNFINTTPMFFV